MSTAKLRTCTLELGAHGAAEPCTGERCGFWEAGGAVVDGGCIIERLGIDVSRPDLAAYLLDLREGLDAARDQRDANAMRSQFARRIGLEL